jgi:hypothetical protein
MRVTASIASLLLLACAGSYHDRYAAEHPDWVPVGPSPGQDVAELVASRTAPSPDDIRLLTHKLTILRTDVEPWEEHDLAALESGAFSPSGDADYALIVSTSCQSTEQLQSYREVQTSWYLLPKNKLVFWDHTEFNTLCVVMNEFVPATLSYVATERRVAAIAAGYPKRSSYANQTYRKGIRLAQAGRVEDAEAMLAQGDREPDSGGESGKQTRFDGPDSMPLDQSDWRKGLRAQLVDAIATAKSGVRP